MRSRRRRSRSSSSSGSRSERRKNVGPNPAANFDVSKHWIWWYIYSTISTRFNKCRNLSTNRTSRPGAHANTYNAVHIALIPILILILTLILILIIRSSYGSSPYHTHHPLIILTIPSSNSLYSSHASYSLYSSSSSSSPSSWDFGHFSMKRIIRFSLRWAAEPMDAVQPVNHPDPGGLGLAVGGSALASFSILYIFLFKGILEWIFFLFSRKII